MPEVTPLQSLFENVSPATAEAYLPLIYDELRQLAARRLAREQAGQTLQPTALVHEAYAQLQGTRGTAAGRGQRWDSPGHFFAAAAEAMRRILIDRARKKRAAKRGGGHKRLDIDADDLAVRATPEQLLAFDDALSTLEREDPVAARLVKLRY